MGVFPARPAYKRLGVDNPGFPAQLPEPVSVPFNESFKIISLLPPRFPPLVPLTHMLPEGLDLDIHVVSDIDICVRFLA